MEWEEHWDTRLTKESIKKYRIKVYHLIEQGNEQELQNFIHELDNELGTYQCVELDHFIKMLRRNLERKYLKHMGEHPFVQFMRQRLMRIYHFWLFLIEEKDGLDSFKASCANAHRHDKIKDRIDCLPVRMRNAFKRVIKKREDEKKTYEDNGLGMLELAKNFITHCNQDCNNRDTLTFEEIERAISCTFPELSLFIFNYCITHNDMMDRLNKVNRSRFSLCVDKTCKVCYSDGMWER